MIPTGVQAFQWFAEVFLAFLLIQSTYKPFMPNPMSTRQYPILRDSTQGKVHLKFSFLSAVPLSFLPSFSTSAIVQNWPAKLPNIVLPWHGLKSGKWQPFSAPNFGSHTYYSALASASASDTLARSQLPPRRQQKRFRNRYSAKLLIQTIHCSSAGCGNYFWQGWEKADLSKPQIAPIRHF